MSARDAGFHSEDGSRVVEGFGFQVAVEAEAHPGGNLHVQADGPAGGFVLLWGEVFGDYSSLNANSHLRVDSVLDDKGVRTSTIAVELEPDPSLRLAGSAVLRPQAPVEYRLEAEGSQLETAWSSLARLPLADSVETVAALNIGGRGTLKAEGSWNRGYGSSQGQLILRDLAVETPHPDSPNQGLELRGLDLDLPFDVTWETTDDASTIAVTGEPRSGGLAVARASVGRFSFDNLASTLKVTADRIELEQALSVPFLRGRARLERIALTDLARPTRHLGAAVTLEALSLAAASEIGSLPPLDGELDGHFPEVRLTPRTLESEGGGEIEVFGGVFRIGGISGEDVFSDLPKIAFSTEFRNIDLLEVTDTFDIGEISGRADGWIRNCILFGGTPVRFQARLESVETPGARQTLSVKAINNLAILGTGGPVDVLKSGVLSIFDRYRYKKLGARMDLYQDHFLVRGLASRGDRELFLEGSWPVRIDIVNAEPGKTVSFSTMLARLRNVDFEVKGF